jgi:hypothetical protein
VGGGVTLLLLCLCTLVHFSCKKIDTPSSDVETASASITEKFFTTPPNTASITLKVIDELKKRNELSGFVANFANTAGYPVWDKSLIRTKEIANTSFASSNVAGSTDTIVYIPIVLANQTIVNGFVEAIVNGTISLSFSLAQDYKNYPSNSTASLASASEYAKMLMCMNFVVFGTQYFKITDPSLFDFGSKPNINPNDYKVKVSQTSNLLDITAEVCIFDGFVTACGSTWDGNENIPHYPTWNCTTYFLDDPYDPNSTGIGGGSPTGGTGSSGSGGQLPYVYPCSNSSPTPFQFNSVLPGGPLPSCPPPIGGTGWNIIPPYVCNYQLSTHDQDVLNEINDEDVSSNSNHQNNNCKGTKRTGNINFQGTLEHWIIELDYVFKNPVYGEIEYSIPNASMTNPANRGYADIVNTLNGNIFEIKPDNLAGLTNGTLEATNYVLKANLNCNPPLQLGTTWNLGNSYPTTILPTRTPNKYLKSEYKGPGVIGYSYINTPTPVPSPVLVPQTALDKLSELIERLRNNLADGSRIIAEYMHQHPELVTYIKGAAISGGVAIIVSTILEDILTLGAGVADDWASFVLAYKIIRFAIKL